MTLNLSAMSSTPRLGMSDAMKRVLHAPGDFELLSHEMTHLGGAADSAKLAFGGIMDHLRDQADYRQYRPWALIADNARDARATAKSIDVPVEAFQRLTEAEYRTARGPYIWTARLGHTTPQTRNRNTHP